MAYEILFADETSEHLAALSAGQKAAVFEAIARQLPHEPARRTRNRKPMDPDKRAFIAPWELRAGNLRVYYAVEDTPSPTVVIVAVGVKVRERLLIGGKDVEP
jgi:mRNA-degrading endonuclease RelE of RelBE toxin-antitoxin system